jgi:YjbE family integral membrane protein
MGGRAGEQNRNGAEDEAMGPAGCLHDVTHWKAEVSLALYHERSPQERQRRGGTLRTLGDLESVNCELVPGTLASLANSQDALSMDFITTAELLALAQVVLVDLVLAGDNAIVVGIAVAGLPVQQRWRVMILGIGVATLLRIVFAAFTVQLLQIIGLLLAGGLLLLWVCWKLWRELRSGRLIEMPAAPHEVSTDGPAAAAGKAPPGKTMRQAVIQIILADVSMSLDNVLAVAGVARDHAWVLVFGLALSVAFMGLAAAIIARLLSRFHWIAYVGLVVIFYVALRMIYDGAVEVMAAAG